MSPETPGSGSLPTMRRNAKRSMFPTANAIFKITAKERTQVCDEVKCISHKGQQVTQKTSQAGGRADYHTDANVAAVQVSHVRYRDTSLFGVLNPNGVREQASGGIPTRSINQSTEGQQQDAQVPARAPSARSGWGVKLCWAGVHVFCVGLLLLLESDLRRQTFKFSWYAGIYYVVFILTVVQYYYTAGSSPGYVIDVMQGNADFEANTKSALDGSNGNNPWLRRSASSSYQNSNGNINGGSSTSDNIPTISETTPLLPSSSEVKRRLLLSLLMICMLCRISSWAALDAPIVEYSRWYLFFETVLTFWTTILYGSAFSKNGGSNWLLHDSVVLANLLGLIACLLFLVTLLIFHTYLAVTDQTTYEKTRRRRINYLKTLPPNYNPFNKGCFKNTYSFCCTQDSTYPIYTIPSADDIEAARSRRSSCFGTSSTLS
ncbi:hypothetical protein AXG93_1626s1010 [Marchantia polymorpha subsp. ruderalis]|uniref:protein S-acyltransferase n=1 Tax=Marchantia polymorpha subsp. ruderalis TaxID=1480154 RepID=A0A176W7V0_MARPO|nr:hypothetical protein AXG93_1626s1010 [Marchantia polymorpha subsp. ruderalis]